MEVYLDLKNDLMHIGDFKTSSMVNASAGFVSYPANDDRWAIMIRDIRYNSTSANYSSINDTFSRYALVDSAFPGVSIPTPIWGNV